MPGHCSKGSSPFPMELSNKVAARGAGGGKEAALNRKESGKQVRRPTSQRERERERERESQRDREGQRKTEGVRERGGGGGGGKDAALNRKESEKQVLPYSRVTKGVPRS